MMVIAISLQVRMLELANRHLGPRGEALIRTIAEHELRVPVEEITYAQLPEFFSLVERQAPSVAGEDAAAALRDALVRLGGETDRALRERLVQMVGEQLGPAAQPFLANMCAQLGLAPDAIGRVHLPRLADAAARVVEPLLGRASAQTLARAIAEAGAGPVPGLAARICEIAIAHLGADGATVVRELCRKQLEIDLEDLDSDSLPLLAQVIEREEKANIGAGWTSAFLAAARQAVTGPSSGLRIALLEVVRQHIGPAGPVFLTRICTKHGLPFDALGYEHLDWLAEAVREEAASLVGARDADVLAGGIAALLSQHR